MKLTNRIILAIILLLPVAVFLYIDYFELRFEEPRRGIVSLEMILSGNYIVPHINGSLYYNKPPLFNWMIVGLFKLFGNYHDWLIKVPSLLSLFIITAANYWFVKKYLGKTVAILSSFFFITSGDIFFFETIVSGEMDLFYTMIVYLQAISIYHFYQEKKYFSLFAVSYFLTAAGFMTKGLPSFLFQGLTILLMAAWHKDWKLLFRWQHFAGIGIMLALLVSYFYAYSLYEDPRPFLTNLFVEAKNKSGLGEKQHKIFLNILLFPVQIARFLAPWSLLFIFFFNQPVIKKIRSNHLLTFCFLFFIVNVPPYWFTGFVKSRYMFMFFPFICTLIAYATVEAKQNSSKLFAAVEKIFLAVMLIATTGFLVAPFISFVADIPFIVVKSLTVAAVLAFVSYLFFKYKSERVLLFILFLVIFRAGFTFYYFPMYEKEEGGTKRKDYYMPGMIAAANGNPIYLSGPHQELNLKAGIGPLVISETNIQLPPDIGFGSVFYYSKFTGRIMQYKEKIETGEYYIVYNKDIEDGHYQSKRVTTLYTCYYDKVRPELALIKVEE